MEGALRMLTLSKRYQLNFPPNDPKIRVNIKYLASQQQRRSVPDRFFNNITPPLNPSLVTSINRFNQTRKSGSRIPAKRVSQRATFYQSPPN